MTDQFGYHPPITALFTVGRPPGSYLSDSWDDLVVAHGLSADDLPELIRLANDWETFWGDDSPLGEDDPAQYAICNAIRAIGQLGTVAGAEALLALLRRNEASGWDIDWVHEDAPTGIALAGAPALPLVEAFVNDTSVPNHARVFAVLAPRRMVQEDEALLEPVVALLRRQLATYREQDRWFNATVIGELVDLKDVDSAELIKEAYLANAVDLSISGDWEDTWVELGLLDERITPRQHWFRAEAAAQTHLQEAKTEQRKKAQFRRQAKAKKKQKAKRKKKRKR